MKPLGFFYRFTRSQQKGILALFVVIILFQVSYYILSSVDFSSDSQKSDDEKAWLANQVVIDSLKAAKKNHKDTIYPFNPNYISDYKGYVLGLTVSQLNRLQEFRDKGNYINSAEDFQKVTGVHDTLLQKLSPYFKFRGNGVYKDKESKAVYAEINSSKSSENIIQQDINATSADGLEKIRGIGPYYAQLIIKRRDALGAFVSMEQMDDFKEFSTEVRSELKKYYKIGNTAEVLKININTASLMQLSRFPYFNKDLARGIITERSMEGKLSKINDLLKITGFPVDKHKIIALYLEF